MLSCHVYTACTQALVFQQDFLQERKVRESFHSRLTDIKDQSAAHVNRLQTRIRELEKEKFNGRATVAADREKFEQLQEDYQISQSQIIAYKKQMDIGKKELEEVRKKVEVKQLKIDRNNLQLSLLKTEVYAHYFR